MKSNIKYKVKFIEVGRDKKSWEITMPTLCGDTMIKSVRKSGALMSFEIDVECYHGGTGWIYAGMRNVGKIEWEEIAE